uniref:EF-hand domain-containing protein n=1 Tax=Phaeomonas parva TaxID=124430 RepID=A0A7S1XN77_9STRA|mmetsp:Transcript_23769/g.74823  ORF Transcript_23769/g.74823 Transcript_23769/m.74823 type:complete len:907 (+) Transcript_23769:352-3072(+)
MLPLKIFRELSRNLKGAIHPEKGSEEKKEDAFTDDGVFDRDNIPSYVDPDKYENAGVKVFLEMCLWCRATTMGETFNNLVTGCIVLAGIIVGMQTYPGMNDDPVLSGFDFFVLLVFTLEFVLKTLGEGMAPWLYFFGREWKWNNFDAIILLFSWDFIPMSGGGMAKILRLFRLMRVAKLMRKIPQLQMIVMGLLGGLKSIFYILLLLFLVFYLYACFGLFYFKENDPFHFGTLPYALLTLFRACTLEDWTDVMYIGMYGCDEYDGGIYLPLEERDGHFMGRFYCENPRPMKWISIAYWVSFIVICSLVMLSLFIGTVTMSMSESMDQMKEDAEVAEREKKLKKAKQVISKTTMTRRNSDRKKMGMMGTEEIKKVSKAERERMRQLKMLETALVGSDMGNVADDDFEELQGKPLMIWYKKRSIEAYEIVESDWFNYFITGVIVLAGMLAGVATYETVQKNAGDVLDAIDWGILGIFVVEFALKVVAEEFEPWRVFRSSWNKFDFVVIVGCALPESMTGGFVNVLRLLRLLRVMKLVKALPQLQVIVTALIMGFQSITYIGIILFMFFYFFGIIGMLLFQENDPWHFGTLDRALLSLFRCSTLEDWTDVMYINIYGCDHYDGYPGECTDPNPNPGLAVMYFLVFIIIGALVLLTLFIGVVTTSMEEAQAKQERDRDIAERIEKLTQDGSLTPERLALFTQVFEKMDLDNDGILSLEELNVGLESTGKEIGEDTVKRMLSSLDSNDSGEVDMANFIETMNKIDTTLSKGTFPNSDHDALVSVAGFPGLFAREKGDKAGATLASTMATTLSSTMASTAAPEPKAKPSGVVIDDKGMPPLPSEPVRKLDDSPTDEFLKGVSQEAETMDDSRVHRFESGDSTIPRANSDTSLALQSPDASVASADISDSPRG